MQKRSVLSVVWLVWLLAPAIACANITLDRVIVYFQPDKRPIQTVNVMNIDTERTFAVKTEVVEVINPGKPDVKRVDSKDIAVAPNAFEIKSQDKRKVRLLLRHQNKSDTEKTYLVTFKPVAPSRPKSQEKADKVSTKIDILVGMGALVLVPPKQINYDLRVSRSGDSLQFTNAGNVSVQIMPRKICKAEGECVRFGGSRIRVGENFEYKLPKGFEKIGLTLSVQAAGKYSAVEFPAIGD